MTKKAIEISDAYDKIKADLIESIHANLKRVGLAFDRDDSDKIEFLGWDGVNYENGITEIHADGTVISNGQEVTFHQLLGNGDITLLDAMSILENLEAL
ncbi:MAG: hypothetical protein KA007_00235 [Candidatus Pacebacteria bacterium]|nr:hypothetical protein [Candidatus Paceibacterota bacterium]